MPLGRPKDNQEAWTLNGTHKILFCIDDVNLFNTRLNTIQQNRYSSDWQRAGLSLNAEKIVIG
jgi:hypothetical protein